MVYGLLEWALRVVLATFILLLLSLLLWFVWGLLVTVAHAPELSYFEVAAIAAIVSVGNWGFSLLRTHIVTTQ